MRLNLFKVKEMKYVLGFFAETDVNKLNDGFGLRGQIEHKLSFIRKNVPKDVKLVLIGHSIGAYMIIEMMKRAQDVEVCQRCLNLLTSCHPLPSP